MMDGKAAGKSQIKVLLAEDDEDDFLLFEEAVAEMKLHVDIVNAKDGVDLLRLLKKPDTILPDIIFLDLNMPCKNGKECLEEIKADKSFDKIPVVIFTSSAHKKDIDETYILGANLFVIKPSSFTGLITVLRDVLTLDWSNYIPQPARKDFVLQSETESINLD